MPKPQAKRINLRKIKLLFRIYSNLSPHKADSAQNPQKNKSKKLAPQKQPNFTSNFASRTPFFRPCYCIRYFAYQSRLCRSCRSWRSISPQWLARPPTRSARLDLRNRRRPPLSQAFCKKFSPFCTSSAMPARSRCITPKFEQANFSPPAHILALYVLAKHEKRSKPIRIATVVVHDLARIDDGVQLVGRQQDLVAPPARFKYKNARTHAFFGPVVSAA